MSLLTKWGVILAMLAAAWVSGYVVRMNHDAALLADVKAVGKAQEVATAHIEQQAQQINQQTGESYVKAAKTIRTMYGAGRVHVDARGGQVSSVAPASAGIQSGAADSGPRTEGNATCDPDALALLRSDAAVTTLMFYRLRDWYEDQSLQSPR